MAQQKETPLIKAIVTKHLCRGASMNGLNQCWAGRYFSKKDLCVLLFFCWAVGYSLWFLDIHRGKWCKWCIAPEINHLDVIQRASCIHSQATPVIWLDLHCRQDYIINTQIKNVFDLVCLLQTGIQAHKVQKRALAQCFRFWKSSKAKSKCHCSKKRHFLL